MASFGQRGVFTGDAIDALCGFVPPSLPQNIEHFFLFGQFVRNLQLKILLVSASSWVCSRRRQRKPPAVMRSWRALSAIFSSSTR